MSDICRSQPSLPRFVPTAIPTIRCRQRARAFAEETSPGRGTATGPSVRGTTCGTWAVGRIPAERGVERSEVVVRILGRHPGRRPNTGRRPPRPGHHTSLRVNGSWVVRLSPPANPVDDLLDSASGALRSHSLLAHPRQVGVVVGTSHADQGGVPTFDGWRGIVVRFTLAR